MTLSFDFMSLITESMGAHVKKFPSFVMLVEVEAALFPLFDPYRVYMISTGRHGVTRHAGSIFCQILTSWHAFAHQMVFLGGSQHADSDFDIRFL